MLEWCWLTDGASDVKALSWGEPWQQELHPHLALSKVLHLDLCRAAAGEVAFQCLLWLVLAITSSQCLSSPRGAGQAELRGWSMAGVLRTKRMFWCLPALGKKGFSTESLGASAFYETALRSGGRGDGKTQPRSPCSGRDQVHTSTAAPCLLFRGSSQTAA